MLHNYFHLIANSITICTELKRKTKINILNATSEFRYGYTVQNEKKINKLH